MVTITAALVAEHDKFRALFDEMEQGFAELDTLAEVHRLARHVEGLLRKHASAEEDLVLLVLNHLPAHKGHSDRFYTEHQEIDSHLTRALMAETPALARDLLRSALVASRKHFKHEERVIFPLIEQVTEMETLTRLGNIWQRRQASALA